MGLIQPIQRKVVGISVGLACAILIHNTDGQILGYAAQTSPTAFRDLKNIHA